MRAPGRPSCTLLLQRRGSKGAVSARRVRPNEPGGRTTCASRRQLASRPMDVLAEPLTAAQVRILGVLVEKQLATPQSYPLTENALITACNQATNRFPVVDYDTSLVRPALIRLRERGLAKRVLRAGERAEKHAHRLDEQLGLSSVAPLAVLAVLMLRGAQTPGELRSRTQRLHPIADAEALDAALGELQDRGFAEPLPRRAGEKQVRWRHLLSGVEAAVETAGPDPTAPSPTTAERDHPRPPSLTAIHAALEALQERVATLERELGLTDEDADDQPAPAPRGSDAGST